MPSTVQVARDNDIDQQTLAPAEAAPEERAAVPTESEVGIRRLGRALIGWLSDDEAIQVLLGRTPMPMEDLTAVRQSISSCRAALATRSRFSPSDPLVDADTVPALEAIRARPEVQAAFASVSWRAALVDLRYVLAFQKLISVEGLDARIAGISENPARLLELCIPSNQPFPPTSAFRDPDGKGYALGSPNPNLRIFGSQVGSAQVSSTPGSPPVPAMALTILVTLGASYLQVVHYNGRFFLRDGYHRSAGLLRAGVRVLPCILVEARSFEEVTGGVPGAFSYEVLYSDRPPFVADFWDDSVACNIVQPTVRKVVRVRGDEFVIEG